MGLLTAPPPHRYRGGPCWHLVLRPPTRSVLGCQERRVGSASAGSVRVKRNPLQTLLTPAAPPWLQASSHVDCGRGRWVCRERAEISIHTHPPLTRSSFPECQDWIRAPGPPVRQKVSKNCWRLDLWRRHRTGPVSRKPALGVLTWGWEPPVIWYQGDYPLLLWLFGVLLEIVLCFLEKDKTFFQIPCPWPPLLWMLYWFQRPQSSR